MADQMSPEEQAKREEEKQRQTAFKKAAKDLKSKDAKARLAAVADCSDQFLVEGNCLAPLVEAIAPKKKVEAASSAMADRLREFLLVQGEDEAAQFPNARYLFQRATQKKKKLKFGAHLLSNLVDHSNVTIALSTLECYNALRDTGRHILDTLQDNKALKAHRAVLASGEPAKKLSAALVRLAQPLENQNDAEGEGADKALQDRLVQGRGLCLSLLRAQWQEDGDSARDTIAAEAVPGLVAMFTVEPSLRDVVLGRLADVCAWSKGAVRDLFLNHASDLIPAMANAFSLMVADEATLGSHLQPIGAMLSVLRHLVAFQAVHSKDKALEAVDFSTLLPALRTFLECGNDSVENLVAGQILGLRIASSLCEISDAGRKRLLGEGVLEAMVKRIKATVGQEGPWILALRTSLERCMYQLACVSPDEGWGNQTSTSGSRPVTRAAQLAVRMAAPDPELFGGAAGAAEGRPGLDPETMVSSLQIQDRDVRARLCRLLSKVLSAESNAAKLGAGPTASLVAMITAWAERRGQSTEGGGSSSSSISAEGSDWAAVGEDAEMVHCCECLVALARADGDACAALGEPETIQGLMAIFGSGPISTDDFVADGREPKCTVDCPGEWSWERILSGVLSTAPEAEDVPAGEAEEGTVAAAQVWTLDNLPFGLGLGLGLGISRTTFPAPTKKCIRGLAASVLMAIAEGGSRWDPRVVSEEGDQPPAGADEDAELTPCQSAALSIAELASSACLSILGVDVESAEGSFWGTYRDRSLVEQQMKLDMVNLLRAIALIRGGREKIVLAARQHVEERSKTVAEAAGTGAAEAAEAGGDAPPEDEPARGPWSIPTHFCEFDMYSDEAAAFVSPLAGVVSLLLNPATEPETLRAGLKCVRALCLDERKPHAEQPVVVDLLASVAVAMGALVPLVALGQSVGSLVTEDLMQETEALAVYLAQRGQCRERYWKEHGLREDPEAKAVLEGEEDQDAELPVEVSVVGDPQRGPTSAQWQQFLDVLVVDARCGGSRKSALLAAQAASSKAILTALIEAGASANTTDDSGLSPLMVALQLGKDAAVDELLSAGADVDVMTDQGTNALKLAFTTPEEERIRSLLAWLAQEPGEVEHQAATILQSRVRINQSVKRVQSIRLGDAVSVENPQEGVDGLLDESKVFREKGDTRMLRALLTAGADPNVSDEDGRFPVHWAVTGVKVSTNLSGHCLRLVSGDQDAGTTAAVLGLLAKHGADLNACDKHGHTALHLALRQGDAAVAHALLDLGANPNVLSTEGLMPLHMACALCPADASGRPPIVQRLLEAGVGTPIRGAHFADDRRRKTKQEKRKLTIQEVMEQALNEAAVPHVITDRPAAAGDLLSMCPANANGAGEPPSDMPFTPLHFACGAPLPGGEDGGGAGEGGTSPRPRSPLKFRLQQDFLSLEGGSPTKRNDQAGEEGDAGECVQAPDSHSEHEGAAQRRCEVVRYLLSLDATEVNASPPPLHLLVRDGVAQWEMGQAAVQGLVEELLSHKDCDVGTATLPPSGGEHAASPPLPPLHHALRTSQPHLGALLISRGADAWAPGLPSALELACTEPGLAPMIPAILAQGGSDAGTAPLPGGSLPPLHTAMQANNAPAVAQLLAIEDMDPNHVAPGAQGGTPVHVACRGPFSQCLDAATALLQAAPRTLDLAAKNPEGETIVDLALATHSSQLLELVLSFLTPEQAAGLVTLETVEAAERMNLSEFEASDRSDPLAYIRPRELQESDSSVLALRRTLAAHGAGGGGSHDGQETGEGGEAVAADRQLLPSQVHEARVAAAREQAEQEAAAVRLQAIARQRQAEEEVAQLKRASSSRGGRRGGGKRGK